MPAANVRARTKTPGLVSCALPPSLAESSRSLSSSTSCSSSSSRRSSAINGAREPSMLAAAASDSCVAVPSREPDASPWEKLGICRGDGMWRPCGAVAAGKHDSGVRRQFTGSSGPGYRTLGGWVPLTVLRCFTRTP